MALSMLSEKQIKQLLPFIDNLKDKLTILQLFNGLLNIVLSQTLHWYQGLTHFFGTFLGVLNGDDVRLLETIGDQFVYDVLLVCELYQVTVLVPFGDKVHVSCLIQLSQIDVSPSQDNCNVLTLDQLFHFCQACEPQSSRRFAYYPHWV